MNTETRQAMARLLAGVAEYVMAHQEAQMGKDPREPLDPRTKALMKALAFALWPEALQHSVSGDFFLATPEKVINVSIGQDRQGEWHVHVGWDDRSKIVTIDQSAYSYSPEE